MRAFFKSLKCEMIYENWILSVDQIELKVFQWIEIWYNKIRRHKVLGKMTIDKF
ncbi:MAG: IS3 family transposase [Bacteroidales bacterium]|nr:IS3 family transposase [Bacteroidales bacterium]